MNSSNTGIWLCAASWCIPMILAFVAGIFTPRIWNSTRMGKTSKPGHKLFGGSDDDA